MKKLNYLFLLAPSLFLITSCQTTPKVDTITELEAQEFIKEKYKEVKPTTAPSVESKVKWKISKDDDSLTAKKYIGQYIHTVDPVASDEEKNGVPIDEARCAQYLNELSVNDMKTPGKDAITTMNWDIYQNLYKSSQHAERVSDLIYKKGPNNGLIIKSSLTSISNVLTLQHTYNDKGLETEFKVEWNKDNLIYTMTIDFKYN